MAKWEEQWARMSRWLQRLQQFREKVPFDRDAAYYLDDIHAFFVEVHSFKDWLINDDEFRAASKVEKNEIESVVSSSLTLKIFADIANGKKHLKPDPKRTHDQPYRSGSKPFLCLSCEVVYEGDDGELFYDVAPRRHQRVEFQYKMLDAMQLPEPEQGRRIRELLEEEPDLSTDEDWESVAKRANQIKANLLRRDFDEEKIALLICVDVIRDRKTMDLDDGIVTLGRDAIAEWELFLDRSVPMWRQP